MSEYKEYLQKRSEEYHRFFNKLDVENYSSIFFLIEEYKERLDEGFKTARKENGTITDEFWFEVLEPLSEHTRKLLESLDYYYYNGIINPEDFFNAENLYP